MEFMHMLHYLDKAQQEAINAKQDALAEKISGVLHEAVALMMQEHGWIGN